ncbi:hypothetical protein PoB_006463000 [Plakobranchus ocellatus]|uniref:Uncharacterized protein n=1 Tax=Plakobranchus ocellatus TaxID=259542 RepID=A0AAV4D215_9GAST|nr:hypothetical protein PoB_006463000 [Plakobranchus ocellatus]
MDSVFGVAGIMHGIDPNKSRYKPSGDGDFPSGENVTAWLSYRKHSATRKEKVLRQSYFQSLIVECLILISPRPGRPSSSPALLPSLPVTPARQGAPERATVQEVRHDLLAHFAEWVERD